MEPNSTNRNKSNHIRTLTHVAMFSAVSVLFLYFARVFPLWEYVLATLAGVAVAFLLMRFHFRAAIYCLLVTFILAAFLIGIDIALPYLLFFGSYPIVKAFIEERLQKNRKNKILHLAIKTLYFVLLMTMIFGVMRLFFPLAFQNVLLEFELVDKSKFFYVLFIIGALVLFILYDYTLSVILRYLENRKFR